MKINTTLRKVRSKIEDTQERFGISVNPFTIPENNIIIKTQKEFGIHNEFPFYPFNSFLFIFNKIKYFLNKILK